LTDYTGSLNVAASGNSIDALILHGSASNVLTVSASPAALTTDHNTPVTFQAPIQTNFADTYTLSGQAPPGWHVSVSNIGSTTVTPTPGLQSSIFQPNGFAVELNEIEPVFKQV
jgi:hypothetical protein